MFAEGRGERWCGLFLTLILLVALAATAGAQSKAERVCVVAEQRFHTEFDKLVTMLTCSAGKYKAALLDDQLFWKGWMSCQQEACNPARIEMFKHADRPLHQGQMLVCSEFGRFIPAEWHCKFF